MSSLDVKNIRQKSDELLITQVSQDEDLITQVQDPRQNVHASNNTPKIRGSSIGGGIQNGSTKGSSIQIRNSQQKRSISQNPPQGMAKSMTSNQILQQKKDSKEDHCQRELLEQALRGTQAQARQLQFLKENLAR